MIKMNSGRNVLDLFSGCGGFTKGLVEAGLNVIAGIDNWERAIESYSANFDHKAICEDLTQLSPEKFQSNYNTENESIDIIVGSPPCQSFSMAGRRKKDDPRNDLYEEFVKYVDFYRPKAFLMENVMGILSKKNSEDENVIDIILSKFEEGYNTKVYKLYASDFYVPQNRRRVIIFGIRKELGIEPEYLQPELTIDQRISVREFLLPKEVIDNDYTHTYLSEKAIQGIIRKKEESKKKGNGFGAQFLDLNKPSYTISARFWKDGYEALVKYNDNEIRRLTVTELKRIQTFPDDYEIIGNYKDVCTQIGNAVPCLFAKYLGLHLIKTLEL
jgi:DNA (cytosine-5)-methyltransferase 1